MITLESVIARIESSNRLDVIRFEYAVFQKMIERQPSQWPKPLSSVIDKIKMLNLCDLLTACMIFDTSFGEFQFLGETLYSSPVSYDKSIGTFLRSPGDQETVFRRFCMAHDIYFTIDELVSSISKRRQFAEHYNGPGNIDAYAQKILDTIQELQNEQPQEETKA